MLLSWHTQTQKHWTKCSSWTTTVVGSDTQRHWKSNVWNNWSLASTYAGLKAQDTSRALGQGSACDRNNHMLTAHNTDTITRW